MFNKFIIFYENGKKFQVHAFQRAYFNHAYFVNVCLFCFVLFCLIQTWNWDLFRKNHHQNWQLECNIKHADPNSISHKNKTFEWILLLIFSFFDLIVWDKTRLTGFWVWEKNGSKSTIVKHLYLNIPLSISIIQHSIRFDSIKVQKKRCYIIKAVFASL